MQEQSGTTFVSPKLSFGDLSKLNRFIVERRYGTNKMFRMWA